VTTTGTADSTMTPTAWEPACAGDMGRINEDRAKAEKRPINAEPFTGSGEVWQPGASTLCPGRKHRDYFANAKAQAWMALRLRFQSTYRAVIEGLRPFDPDALISINPKLGALLGSLSAELSQPTHSINSAGKILIDKQPDNTKSPNLADSVMIAFQPGTRFDGDVAEARTGLSNVGRCS